MINYNSDNEDSDGLTPSERQALEDRRSSQNFSPKSTTYYNKAIEDIVYDSFKRLTNEGFSEIVHREMIRRLDLKKNRDE